MKHVRTRGHLGFALVEVVVAVGILGLIGLLTMGTFSRAMDSRDRAEELTEHYRQVRQAMLRMAREISAAYLSHHHNCERPHSLTIFKAKSASNGMRLDFTAFSHFKTRADANESDQEELSYFVDEDPDSPNKHVLMRRSQARVDEEPDEGGTAQVLAENVTELRFEFYDAKNDRWEDEWDTTQSDHRDKLPLFVAIHLTTIDPQGKEEKLTTKTRTYVREPILIAGTGFSRCLE